MKTTTKLGLLALPLVALALIGCGGRPSERSKDGNGADIPAHTAARTNDEAFIRANLAQLNPEDRALAEAQGHCAVEPKNPLGSMGVPIKVTLKDQPVFLCCDGCEVRARAHADRTLARAQQLKEERTKRPAP